MDMRKLSWAQSAKRRASSILDRITSMDGTIIVEDLSKNEDDSLRETPTPSWTRRASRMLERFVTAVDGDVEKGAGSRRGSAVGKDTGLPPMELSIHSDPVRLRSRQLYVVMDDNKCAFCFSPHYRFAVLEK